MTRLERLLFLNNILLTEMPRYREDAAAFPKTAPAQRRLLRSLMNVRPAGEISEDFLREQDILLKEESKEKGVVLLSDLPTVATQLKGDITRREIPADKMILWQGDITRLAADGIVNAANSALLGCFVPCHSCIDNAIHSAAGVQLRNDCARLMKEQGHEEPIGKAKITPAFNLPGRYILHTVGPIIAAGGNPTAEEKSLLSDCYISCLELAAKHRLQSLAFCCISTGEFHFPGEMAAHIAVKTVSDWLTRHDNGMAVVFNVFKDEDLEIYRKVLGIK
ncbi:MAG: protein-ADP-ribose hydrolase [Schwartzia sp.]|nr:protein-ADP-ribose hydrolase [Schwartzia sp. (in: firmicutes)]